VSRSESALIVEWWKNWAQIIGFATPTGYPTRPSVKVRTPAEGADNWKKQLHIQGNGSFWRARVCDMMVMKYCFMKNVSVKYVVLKKPGSAIGNLLSFNYFLSRHLSHRVGWDERFFDQHSQ